MAQTKAKQRASSSPSPLSHPPQPPAIPSFLFFVQVVAATFSHGPRKRRAIRSHGHSTLKSIHLHYDNSERNFFYIHLILTTTIRERCFSDKLVLGIAKRQLPFLERASLQTPTTYYQTNNKIFGIQYKLASRLNSHTKDQTRHHNHFRREGATLFFPNTLINKPTQKR